MKRLPPDGGSMADKVEYDHQPQGKAISDRLWEHECGCIEGVRPYRLYRCQAHSRKSHSWIWRWRKP